jgi:serine/alanine adding enzyme
VSAATRAGEIVEVEPADWDDLLAGLGIADVYLQRDYVEASCLLDGGRPAFLAAGGVAFGAIVREIPGAAGLRDVTTPYGYGGPAGPGDGEAFYAAYDAWCRENGVVTTFIRFHPLLGNARLAPPSVRRDRLANTATWPLAPEADLLAGMHQMHRRGVRKALREGVEASFRQAPDRLHDFVVLYEDAMRRHDADSFYFFPGAYWDALAGPLRDRLLRADAYRDGELLATQLHLLAPPWLHYHLGAASDEGFRLGASKLLFHESARWARDEGLEEFHLGSGLGGSENSLWQFKQRFSPHPGREFLVGKIVHDAGAYRGLGGDIAADGFFPSYRAPA